MRQLLVLGFYCQVYRQEPTCRIYVNDVFLDEFNIKHKNDTRPQEIKNIINLNPSRKNKTDLLVQNLPVLRFYEIDHKTKQTEIKIEIQNNDNNFTNGFMTKSTLVKLSHLFLIGKNLIENINYLKKRYKFTRNNIGKYLKFKSILEETKFFYCKNTMSTNNLINNFAREVTFKGDNRLDKILMDHWVGGTGTFNFKLKKKYGFWLSSNDHETGPRWLGGDRYIMETLYDKYTEYENQRSSN